MRPGRIRQSERLVRGLIGAGMLGYYGFHPAATWALLGLVPLFTSVANFCPLYLARRRGSPETDAADETSGERQPESQSAESAPAPSPSPAKPAKVIHATDRTFDALVLKTSQPVLVDFWATWCAPCRAVAPVLDALAEELAGKARIVKVDVDRCPRTAQAYRIRNIPTLALFSGGEIADVLVGAQSKERLRKVVAKALRG